MDSPRPALAGTEMSTPSHACRRPSHRAVVQALCLGVICGWGLPAAAQEPTPEVQRRAGEAFFESRIRPLLVERCVECHSADGAESDLAVDSLAGLLRGGTRGPAIVPGKPQESLLLSALKHGELLKMPPKEKLPAAAIADVARWVELGAPWPDARPASVATVGVQEPEWTDEQRAYWAFQPPTRPSLPPVARTEWVQSPIDHFILAKLEAQGLEPAEPCDPRTWLRRVTFDLTGLPPTPEEAAAFAVDTRPDARARVVDRLLASPRYGERWGRHWLDVARYADSNGLDENLAYGNAYHYRDYVVQAWNADLPFNQFLEDQLAGDVLADPSQPARYLQQLRATGFLSLGAKMLAEDDPVKMQMDIIDEQVDTLGRAFLGLTLGCARCHDHKFDPVSMADYYALAGILKSTRTMENFSVVARWQERPLALPEQVAAQKALQEEIASRQTAIQDTTRREAARILDAAQRQWGEYLLAAANRQQRHDRLASLRPRLQGDAATPDIAGAFFTEAEQYLRGNVLRDTTNYGAGIGVLVNRGETPNFVEYEYDLPAAGLFQLDVRYAAAAARPCTLTINGQLVKSDLAGGVTGGWNPEHQTWRSEGLYSLQAGKNVVRLEHAQYFPHIDKLLWTPADSRDLTDAFPRRDASYEPVPAFVEAWRVVSEKRAEEHRPVLGSWWRAYDGELVPVGETELERQLWQEPRPASVAELAGRYQQLAARALDQPDDEALAPLRDLLTKTAEPLVASDQLEPLYPDEVRQELAAQRAAKQQLERELPVFPETMAVAELPPENLPIHYRGSHLTLGPEVPRRFPRILAEDASPIAPTSSGRRELAEWLTSPMHPLTSRVIVNRLWQWHFGEGLVRSTDNFGELGERPTHPELLDWLATELQAHGWSLKQLHRTLVLSATYGMSGRATPRNRELDAENRLWSRFPRRRLEAEAIRDAMLAISGNLDLAMGGSLLPIENRKYVTSTANVSPKIYDSKRRTLYLPVVRSALYEVLQAFDFADPSMLSAQRQSTTVAPQALFMLNSAFVSEQSLSLADELLARADLDDAGRLRTIYQRIVGRAPTESEQSRILEFVGAYAQAYESTTSQTEGRRRAWHSVCRAVLASNEFIFIE